MRIGAHADAELSWFGDNNWELLLIAVLGKPIRQQRRRGRTNLVGDCIWHGERVGAGNTLLPGWTCFTLSA